MSLFSRRRYKKAVKRAKRGVHNPFQFGSVAATGILAWPAEVRFLPREFLEHLIEPRNRASIERNEAHYLDEVEQMLREAGGFIQPVTLVVDGAKVCLQDGHHRIIVSPRLDIDYIPAVWRPSDEIRKFSIPNGALIRELWDRT